MEYNERAMMREVVCLKCKNIVRTSEVDLFCYKCQFPMVNVVRSIIDGEVITGKDESGKWIL